MFCALLIIQMSQSDDEMEDTRMSTEDEVPITNIRKKLDDEFATPVKPAPEKSSVVDSGQDHMKVYLRVRPCTNDEKNKGEDQVCHCIKSALVFVMFSFHPLFHCNMACISLDNVYNMQHLSRCLYGLWST